MLTEVMTLFPSEYMAFPRMLALAEIAWSPRAARDWRHFTERLPAHLARLDLLEVNCRAPEALEEGILMGEGIGAWRHGRDGE